MPILQLPTDIIVIILSHLTDSRDLCACNWTCRAFYNLFRLFPQLYHKLSLARAGLVDTLYGVRNNSLQDRTRLIADLERRWLPRGLSSRRQLKILLDNPCIDYQICNGVIVTGILSPTGDFLHELQVYRLPSYLTGLKSKLWRHKLEANTSIRQMKADPSQDLLVLVGTNIPNSELNGAKHTVDLHLRTLSTNDKHPAASSPTLRLSEILPTRSFINSYSCDQLVVRICQDILGILTNSDSAESSAERPPQTLVIWQWTSGQQIVLLSPGDLIIDDLSFIGRQTILLTHSATRDGPGISTMRLVCGQPYSRRPSNSVSPLSSLETSVFFQLPSPPRCFHECLKMGCVKIINEPLPDTFQLIPTNSNHAPSVFTPDPSESSTLIAFSLSIQLRAVSATQIDVIKHTVVARASLFSTPAYSLKHSLYKFSEWSLQGTHWFSCEPGFLYGQRYVLASFQRPRTNVDIYDFNPYHTENLENPDTGWRTLFKDWNSKVSHEIVPKLSTHRTKCGHKRYLDSELKSTMLCRQQSMKAGLVRAQDRVIGALDSESIITVEFERGGLVREFVAYNI